MRKIREIKEKKIRPVLAIMLAGMLLLSACGSASGKDNTEEQQSETPVSASEAVSAAFDAVDTDDSWSEADATYLTI